MARCAAEQRVCGRVLGLLNRDGEHFDDLADVRRSESVVGDAGTLHRDDRAHQDVEVAVSVGDGGADAVCGHNHADRVL